MNFHMNRDEFADDLLRGADEISQYLFGDAKYRRRVYYLHSRGRLPTFNLGTAGLCARRSTLLKFCEDQERRKGNLI
jgi:hypothetical protein